MSEQSGPPQNANATATTTNAASIRYVMTHEGDRVCFQGPDCYIEIPQMNADGSAGTVKMYLTSEEAAAVRQGLTGSQ